MFASLHKTITRKLARSPFLNAYDAKHEFFNHTRSTWLYNAESQHKFRQVIFDVHELRKVAESIPGVTACVGIRKLAEGTSNRVFELQFDNGIDLIAKIPYPIAGPAHFMTASEVATMTFLRETLKLPVPRVLSWCSRADSTPVKSEYIIMEKVSGEQMYAYHEDLTQDDWANILAKLVSVERSLADTPFPWLGSLYFQNDLHADVPKFNFFIGEADRRQYCIGPSVERRFWRGARANMSLSRGPWSNIANYAHDVIDCEIQWLQNHVKPHSKDTPLYFSERENSPEAHISLLEKYRLVIDDLVPTDDFNEYSLWHPDLHLSNIMISKPRLGSSSPRQITGIIDWQGTIVDHLLIAGSVPDFVSYTHGEYVRGPPPGDVTVKPTLPENFNGLSKAEKKKAQEELKAAERYRLYTALTEKVNPKLHRYQQNAATFKFALRPLYWCSRTWDEGLALFERFLIDICDNWHKISLDSPCPISFSDEEREENKRIVLLSLREVDMTRLCSEIGIDPEGAVSFDGLSKAREKNKTVMAQFLAEASDSERDYLRRRWPFQDGALSLSTETCQ